MLQDIPTPTSTLHEARPFVLETERLMLRRPTLADVKAITRLANDRRIAENTRRLPHPYLGDHAAQFINALADAGRETVFLIERDYQPSDKIRIIGPRFLPDDSGLDFKTPTGSIESDAN